MYKPKNEVAKPESKVDSGDSINIEDSLFKRRIIVLDDEVTSQITTKIMAQIVFLNASDKTGKKPIIFWINSPGGDMYSALGITDVMRASRSPIYTVCVGVAASAGAMILAAGNKRFALPSTQIMVHCHWQSYDEAPSLTHHDLMIEAKQSIYLYDLNVKYYQDVTGQSLKVVKKLLERNAWMGPEEAKSINIIDTIGWDIQSWIK